ncbi:MAG: glycosyltransferase [bacterium]|nr:glycosyltransferase [bacterium]
MKSASVIIISYNNSHNLEECLRSLIEQDYDRSLADVEIIVVDSGSTDNSVEILKKYRDRIKVIPKPIKFSSFHHLAPAIARNIGAQNTNGEILVFTDGDCIPPKSWVKSMFESFDEFDVDCIIGNREPDVGQGIGTFIKRYDFILYSEKFLVNEAFVFDKETIEKNKKFMPLAGNNFALKKTVWNEIGGMKECFKNPTGEDVMLESEIIKRGYKILFNPGIRVVHIHPISLRKMMEKAIQRGESNYLQGKHSRNFISWKLYAKRGHMLNHDDFLRGILIGIIILGFAIKFGFSFQLISIILIGFFILWTIKRLFDLDNQLCSLRKIKGDAYKTMLNLNLSQKLFFIYIHTFLKDNVFSQKTLN